MSPNGLKKSKMESIGVVMPHPTFPYLEQQLGTRFNLLCPWKHNNAPSPAAATIRAAVVNSVDGADASLIEAFPMLEIVSCYGVGVDKIDLSKCAQKGIRVTNTPGVLTHEAADVAMSLILSLLRRLCRSDLYVRGGNWKLHGDYPLTTKTLSRFVSSMDHHHHHHQASMKSIGVLMTYPVNTKLEQELAKRLNLFRLWDYPSFPAFSEANGDSICAVVGCPVISTDAEMMESLAKLEIVCTHSLGLDAIDLGECRERGIRVANTPTDGIDDVADLAIGLALAVLRRICDSDRFVKNGLWPKSGFDLTTKVSGKTVGIVGLGRIGMAVAKRAEAFNCRICYHSRTVKAESNYKHYPSVVELASNCHILVVACSLTKETHHIINREVINALGPKGVLINIGRGKHVDQTELVSALVEGRLGGAGLDVFENEPDVPQELFALDNVVLLPHVGSATVETRTAMADLVIANLEAHFMGKPLLTPVL